MKNKQTNKQKTTHNCFHLCQASHKVGLCLQRSLSTCSIKRGVLSQSVWHKPYFWMVKLKNEFHKLSSSLNNYDYLTLYPETKWPLFADDIFNIIWIKKVCVFIKISLIVPRDPINNRSALVLDSGSVSHRRQVIVWTNDDIVHRRIMLLDTSGPCCYDNKPIKGWLVANPLSTSRCSHLGSN